jgi:hypothetical protein
MSHCSIKINPYLINFEFDFHDLKGFLKVALMTDLVSLFVISFKFHSKSCCLLLKLDLDPSFTLYYLINRFTKKRWCLAVKIINFYHFIPK